MRVPSPLPLKSCGGSHLLLMLIFKLAQGKYPAANQVQKNILQTNISRIQHVVIVTNQYAAMMTTIVNQVKNL